MEIENKRVLVTGASRGLGRALVTAFLEAGAREVLAGARKPADLEALKSERVTPVQLDVTNDADVNAVAGLGAIDILVNNAGVAGFGNPLTMDFETIQEELAVNYLGVLRVTRAVAPGMIAREDGMIVNIATAFAKVNLPLVGTYSATKAALLSLGQAFRAYLVAHNVRLITVMPTTIDTDMSRDANVPKLTKEFVAAEILDSIREERHDPAIGDEAKGVFEKLANDPIALEKALRGMVVIEPQKGTKGSKK
ncbi:MAG TPA: SDR family NAD(P)-dependent oxidoreductase [Pyrinomonadaceae bacterium]|jgi:NAD(P)-dependent dehydrogenase (short-subunit alcohol dehydrogenase family)|nr:SDR family NAD(P)-dependent oxidoreductase [Pyrinomonadaceae bacterium]